jgi:hypothetical protein
MRNCGCGTGSCACKIEAGSRSTVTGTGSAQDPYVVSSDILLSVADSATFDLILEGDGTVANPWVLRIAYASTARLNDHPEVRAEFPTDGQALLWNDTTHLWEAGPVPTASPGLLLTDNQSLDGDGSAGDRFRVLPNNSRYIEVTLDGVGLTDDGLNRMVRVYPDAATRASDPVTPDLNTISLLNDDPGRIDFWDGAEWTSISNGIRLDIQPGQFLSLSGPYAGGGVVQYVAQLSVSTDVDGSFEVIPAADLATYGGVLSVQVACAQPLAGGVPWMARLIPDTDRILGYAYRIDTGALYAGVPLTGIVTALLY